MTVTIPVSADPAQVLRAFEDIRRAMRAAGQEGRALADLDFSHPELQGLESSLRRIDENFKNLQKVGRGETARGARNPVFTDALDLTRENIDKVYPSQAQAERFTAQAGRYVLGGTQFAPMPSGPGPTPPPPPPRPPRDESETGDDDYPGRRRGGGDGGEGKGAGIFDMIGGPIKAALTFALGQAGVTGAMKGIGEAYSGAEQEDTRNDSLMRRLHDVGTGFDDLRDKVRGLADTIHVQDNEAQALTESWVRLTGSTDSAIAVRDATYAGQVARGMGLQPGAMVQTLGSASYLGEDPKRFAMLITEAMKEGHQDGQAEQVMSALLHWTETSTRALVTHSDVSGFAAMYSGLNAMGLPGLKGQGAEALIGQMNSAVSQGGAAGMAGQIMTYNAFRQNGVSDPFEIEYRLAGGMFEKLGNGTVYDAVRGQVNRMYAGQSNYRRWDAMAHYFGINPMQAAALDRYKPGQIGQTMGYLGAAGIDIGKLSGDSLTDISSVIGAGNGDLDAWRKRLLGRKDMTDGDRDYLNGATSADDLRKRLVTTLGSHGIEKTEGQKVIDASADLGNKFERVAGMLVGPINDLKTSFASMLDPVQRIAGSLEKEYGGSDTGNTITDIGAALGGDANAQTRLGAKLLNATTGKAEQRNNPLNLRGKADSPGQARLIGISGNGFGIYGSMVDGSEATGWQLLHDQERHGAKSIADLVRQWDSAPGDAAKLPGYISRVAKRLGVDPNAPFNLRSGANLEHYIAAAAPEEGSPINDTVQLHAGVQRLLGRLPDVAMTQHVTVEAKPIVVEHRDSKGQRIMPPQTVPLTVTSKPKPAGTSPLPPPPPKQSGPAMLAQPF